jgi:hypothetical protein
MDNPASNAVVVRTAMLVADSRFLASSKFLTNPINIVTLPTSSFKQPYLLLSSRKANSYNIGTGFVAVTYTLKIDGMDTKPKTPTTPAVGKREA